MHTMNKILKAGDYKRRIISLIDKIGAFRCLLILYFLFIITHILLNGYCKHIETYMDEWYYYGIAECLAKGMGFPAIYGEKCTTYSRLLYSLLIAPGFMVSNRLLQFQLITMLNAIYIGSGIFPVYLIAKKVLENEKYALFAGAIYLFLPDTEFTSTFMTENIWLPVCLWIIYFFFQLVDDDADSLHNKRYPFARKTVTWILFLVSVPCMLYIKDSGITMIVALTIYFCSFKAAPFLKKIFKTHPTRTIIVIGLLLLLAVILTCTLYASSLYSISSSLKGDMYYIYYLFEEPVRFFRCYIYTWATDILAIGVFPVVLPILVCHRLDNRTSRLFKIILLITLISNLGIVLISLATTDQFNLPEFRLHQRYICYLWILYIIVFLRVLQKGSNISNWMAILSVMAVTIFCTVFNGAIIGSAVDTSLLLWAINWMNHPLRWSIAILLFVCIGFILLLRKSQVLYCLFFFSIMATVIIYDHYLSHEMMSNSYRFNYSEIKEVEDFITENKDDTFLIAMIPNSIELDDVHLNAKIADSFLTHPNVIYSSATKITGIENNQGIDLKNIKMEDLGISIVGSYNFDEIDYIVLTTEMIINQEDCKEVLKNTYFNIYQLNDKTKIPYIERINKWNQPGKVLFYPEDEFSSNYYKKNNMVFVSGDHPDYVLYGPYISLQPGKYNITIHYSYNEDTSGKIGTMDLAGSTIDSSKKQIPIYSNKKSVSLSLDLEKICENFEIRIFSDVPGIEVTSVEVNTSILTYVEIPGYIIHRYIGVDNHIIREEYYSQNGKRVMNTSAYHAVDYDYDYGNKVRCIYYDIEGKPTKTTGGYTIVKYGYNNLRQINYESYYNQNDQPVNCTGKSHAMEYDRNENGDIIETRYFDENKKRTELWSGQAMSRKMYNKEHLAIREEYYDKAYKPTILKTGYFAVEYEYDANGNIAVFRYYDIDGNPVRTTYGYAVLRREYNEEHQIIRQSYFDEKDEPVESDGFYVVEYVRDTAGHAVEEWYYNLKEEPVENSNGVAHIVRKYKQNGELSEEKQYQADGSEVLQNQ